MTTSTVNPDATRPPEAHEDLEMLEAHLSHALELFKSAAQRLDELGVEIERTGDALDSEMLGSLAHELRDLAQQFPGLHDAARSIRIRFAVITNERRARGKPAPVVKLSARTSRTPAQQVDFARQAVAAACDCAADEPCPHLPFVVGGDL